MKIDLEFIFQMEYLQNYLFQKLNNIPMTSKIDKVLAKLDKKKQRAILQILQDIAQGNRDQYDCKPIHGKKHIYRIRKGNIRVVFFAHQQNISIINV